MIPDAALAATADDPALQASAERALVARCALGDRAAWEELVAAHDRRVQRVLLRAVGARCAHDLPDLRQEVWSRLLTDRCAALRGFRAERPGALAAFLARTALRVAIDFGRRQGRRSSRETALEGASDVAAATVPADEAAARREAGVRLQQALEVVAQGERRARDLVVYRAHFVDGLSPAEIAALGVGLSTKGVETLLLRGRARIAALLSPGGREATA
jgi:RNA polymerase sigma factor (sigma-70 family)